MNIRDRIGIDIGRKLCVEDAVDWAIENDVTYIDCQIDVAPNALQSFDEARAAPIRDACAEAGVHLGLHTLSAVNIAEIAPYVCDAVDAYLKSYVDASVRLGAEWIVVHAGYHFTSDIDERMQSGLERLKRLTAYAEAKGARLLLENLNWERMPVLLRPTRFTGARLVIYGQSCVPGSGGNFGFPGRHADRSAGRGAPGR
jgi:sugar phosphate isomerase/epimerase